ncbi:MAG: 30S ribosomal protein S6 [Candidatus Margulisiibacteriota bacterium]|jgi:small subunit ribosomal protein S6
MNNYEIKYVLTPTLTEDRAKEAIIKMEKLINDNKGQIVSTEDSGRQGLTCNFRNAKNVTTGIFVLTTFKMAGANVRELERKIKLFDQVMRYLIVNNDNIPAPRPKKPRKIKTEGETPVGEEMARVEAPTA